MKRETTTKNNNHEKLHANESQYVKYYGMEKTTKLLVKVDTKYDQMC